MQLSKAKKWAHMGKHLHRPSSTAENRQMFHSDTPTVPSYLCNWRQETTHRSHRATKWRNRIQKRPHRVQRVWHTGHSSSPTRLREIMMCGNFVRRKLWKGASWMAAGRLAFCPFCPQQIGGRPSRKPTHQLMAWCTGVAKVAALVMAKVMPGHLVKPLCCWRRLVNLTDLMIITYLAVWPLIGDFWSAWRCYTQSKSRKSMNIWNQFNQWAAILQLFCLPQN